MPPLESKKLVFRMVAGVRGQRRRKRLAEVNLMFIDVRKAHLNAVCEEEEWVELPEEFWEHGRYARLKRWLYGMRKTAAGLEEDYAKIMLNKGFRRGRGAPTVFHNEKTEVQPVVHADDFTFSGTKCELNKMRKKMMEWYDIEDRWTALSGEKEMKEVTILGRQVRWKKDGIEYEADAGHSAKLMKAEGLEEDSKTAVGPAVKMDGGREAMDEIDLEEWEKTEFRSSGARLNYLGQDRSDIQYAVKMICQGMSKPTEGGKAKIKRAVRYLVGAKRLVSKYREKGDGEETVWVDVFVDSDWASGWERIRERRDDLRRWGRSEALVEDAESAGAKQRREDYAMVTGGAEGLGLQALAEDLGWEVKVRVWTDSSAAKAVANRRCLGKLRHVELK